MRKCWAQGHGLWPECNVVCVQNHWEGNILFSARPHSVNFCFTIQALLSLTLLESNESVQLSCVKSWMVVDMWDWMAICPAQCTSACDIEFHVGFH